MGEVKGQDLPREEAPNVVVFQSDGFALAEEFLADIEGAPFCPRDFDDYHFEGKEPLGRGNMGEVWLASDQSLARKVAIKFLLNSPDPTAWAKRETQLLGSLNHRYIAQIYHHAALEDGTPWFSM